MSNSEELYIFVLITIDLLNYIRAPTVTIYLTILILKQE